MSSSDFPVGSVVYFLAAKTEKVLPAQIVERIDRTSMAGIKSTYIIAVKSSNGNLKKIEVDPEKTKNMMNAAKKHAQKNFTKDKMSALYYKELFNPKK